MDAETRMHLDKLADLMMELSKQHVREAESRNDMLGMIGSLVEHVAGLKKTIQGLEFRVRELEGRPA
jgi:hypothetical protein